MRVSVVWHYLLTVQLLLCIGTGLVSIVLPEQPEPSGYYDGDGDDAVVAAERVATLGDMAITPGPVLLPVPTRAPFARTPTPRNPLPPRRSLPPPLRSPPA